MASWLPFVLLSVNMMLSCVHFLEAGIQLPHATVARDAKVQLPSFPLRPLRPWREIIVFRLVAAPPSWASVVKWFGYPVKHYDQHVCLNARIVRRNT